MGRSLGAKVFLVPKDSTILSLVEDKEMKWSVSKVANRKLNLNAETINWASKMGVDNYVILE